MEVYAAQVDRMDQGIGRVLDTLERLGRLDNTLVVFLSDNGGCAEELDVDFVTAFVPMQDTTREGEPVVPGNVPGLMPGSEATYMSYGRSWAHLSNTPFREYKHWVHEGGIATPLVARWPRGLSAESGSLHREPFQLTDVLPTLLDAAGATYPRTRGEVAVPPAEGRSMLPALNGADPGARRPVLGARGQLRRPLGPLEAGPQARHRLGALRDRVGPRRGPRPGGAAPGGRRGAGRPLRDVGAALRGHPPPGRARPVRAPRQGTPAGVGRARGHGRRPDHGGSDRRPCCIHGPVPLPPWAGGSGIRVASGWTDRAARRPSGSRCPRGPGRTCRRAGAGRGRDRQDPPGRRAAGPAADELDGGPWRVLRRGRTHPAVRPLDRGAA